ncbi:MAG: amidophosphoribosyltransferase [Bacteroidetes bacterium HGW-Bacteroidetes-2]|jgi:ComF family protein|nr:MAG: amidophosphoribosyltransferase [Bacteroidetes bacterium HGW-Bacteroidetes-2]
MLNLFFPAFCRGCLKELIEGEKDICSICRHNLPLASFHKNGGTEMVDIFYGRIPVVHATALFYFKKNNLTQKFVHALKYKKAKNIGVIFGDWLGEELSACKEYHDVDAIIPVPLHKKKLRQRGYNQVEGFGKKIANALQKPYIDDVLLKITPTTSQVFKERISRIFSNDEVFAVQQASKIENKHLLLVDDIITTGATLEACSKKLLQIKGVKLSFATIAITK